METEAWTETPEAMDPQAQLAMLAAVQDATELEAWLPPTPVWHAPLLAATIAGFALVTSDVDEWQLLGVVIGGIALLIAVVDQLRRQRVLPRRTKKPLRILAFYGFTMVVTFTIAGLWLLIDWPANVTPRVLTLAGSWLATTLVFALGISATNRVRNHWAGLSR